MPELFLILLLNFYQSRCMLLNCFCSHDWQTTVVKLDEWDLQTLFLHMNRMQVITDCCHYNQEMAQIFRRKHRKFRQTKIKSTWFTKPPSIIEDPPKNFFHSNFRFFPAKICENLKIFDEHNRRPGVFYYEGGFIVSVEVTNLWWINSRDNREQI